MIFTAISCDESILDTTPYGQTTTDNFWKTASDAESAANALYHPLPAENYYGHREMTLINIPSDDEYRAGDHAPHSDLENFTFDPSHTYFDSRSEEHTSELQSRGHLVCRLLLEKKKQNNALYTNDHI